MYRKAHRRFRNNQRFTGNITGLPVTYSVALTQELRNSRERESCERQTDETDRRVADDDVTSESHKTIAQMNRTNKVAQKQCCRHFQEWNDKTTLGMLQSNSGAYGVPETG